MLLTTVAQQVMLAKPLYVVQSIEFETFTCIHKNTPWWLLWTDWLSMV